MKKSTHHSMLYCDPETISDTETEKQITYNGYYLHPLSKDQHSDIVRVVDVVYDNVAGILRVIRSDNSVKLIHGFMTELTLDQIQSFEKYGVKGVRGQPGKDGLDGRDGREGLPGCPGVRGDRGSTGQRGEQGRTGPKGLPGIRGETGVEGVKGNRGFRGDPGVAGDRGMVGLQGDMGLRGEQGIPGLQGFTGYQGATGCIGETGRDGLRGERGAQGPKGDTGPPGLPGKNGIDATPGRDGSNGTPGPVKSIIGGDNVDAKWEPDDNGNMVKIRLSAYCCPCPPTPEPNKIPTNAYVFTFNDETDLYRASDDSKDGSAWKPDYDKFMSVAPDINHFRVFHVSTKYGGNDIYIPITGKNPPNTVKITPIPRATMDLPIIEGELRSIFPDIDSGAHTDKKLYVMVDDSGSMKYGGSIKTGIDNFVNKFKSLIDIELQIKTDERWVKWILDYFQV